MPLSTAQILRCCTAGLLVSLAGEHAAAAVAVRVRGNSAIEARVVSGQSGVEVRGTLSDDLGSPIGEASVALTFPIAGGSPPALLEPKACPQLPAVRRAGTQVLADTDGAGRFCVRLPGRPVGSRINVRFAGNEYFDATESIPLRVDASRRSVRLRFAPQPHYLSLDRVTQRVGVDTGLEPANGPPELLQLALWLSTPRGEHVQLGAASVLAGQHTRFEVESDRLHEPGPATLTVAFAGSDTLQAAQHSTVIERTTRVTLTLLGPLGRADPSDGIPISVAVSSRSGAVPSGAVEAVVDARSVGAAQVNSGTAQVVASFASPHGKEVPITLRYLPSAPWWKPGPPLVATIQVAPTSPWRLWPWGLAVAAIAGWVVRSSLRPTRRQRRRARTSTRSPSGRASIEVLQRGPPRAGWQGRVVDAHEGVAIAGARIVVVVPTFGDNTERAAAETDAEGRFALPPIDARTEGAQLCVTAAWHTRLGRPLPAPGHLHVSLVSRRRALLNRLVDWAGRMGHPWVRRGEATPGEVGDVARAQGSDRIASWALAVEEAAFGPDRVDERRERDVRRREPHWKGNEDAGR